MSFFKSYHVKENDILYQGGFTKHSTHSVTDNFACIYIYFLIDENTTKNDSFFLDVHHIKSNEMLKKKFISILNEYNSKSYNHQMKTKIILYEILKEMLDIKTMNDKNANLYMYALKNAIDYLEQNYFKNDISIDYLANLCNYTTTHFTNLFKKVYNTTPKNYIIDLRMQKAKDLLTYSTYSILQIAEITGYSNLAYFSAAFKNAVGCSPAAYRKKNG